jgi:CheY-like chemotaxis protein
MSDELHKILYVEDDEDVAEVAKMTLEDLGGFEVNHNNCGSKALEALETYVPDLILLDVMMPGMDGPETMQYMRGMPNGKDTPVVFMTAKAQVHEQQSYLDLGAVGVLVKPFDPLTLCDSLRALWKKANNE